MYFLVDNCDRLLFSHLLPVILPLSPARLFTTCKANQATFSRMAASSSKEVRAECSGRFRHNANSFTQAQAMLIDPLNAPEPSEETGLNTHFGNTMAPAKPRSSTATSSPRTSLGSNNPFRDPGHPSPPTKAGASVIERPASRENFPKYREEAFAGHNAPRRSGSGARPPVYEDFAASGSGPARRRGSSLRERFPGDESHKPLDMVRRESKKASRSPHLTKRHLPGADVIDRLDPALGGRAYHHEGPYDAASLARNTGKHAPIAALETSNQEALKATPKENIKDAVERHQPLDGVAVVPPGQPDQFGRTYQYEEGTDMMREGTSSDAGYKRWPGKVRIHIHHQFHVHLY